MTQGEKLRIGFAGAGKAGTSVAKYIAEVAKTKPISFEVVGFYSKTFEHTQVSAELTYSKAFSTLEELCEASDIVSLSVRDGDIPLAWDEAKDFCKGKFVCHLSGSVGSEIFPGAKELGISVGSIHPLAALYDRETAWGTLLRADFTIEGDEKFLSLARKLLDGLGNTYAEIEADKKPLYHAASAICANLTCATAYAATELYKKCGLPDSFAENAWRVLFIENAKNIIRQGPIVALTGPIDRGDPKTVARHLAALKDVDEDIQDVYAALSLLLVDGSEKIYPEKDLKEIEHMLKKVRRSK